MWQRHLLQSQPESTGKADFEALLKSSKSAEESNAVDSSQGGPQVRREEWIRYLGGLYKQIELALSPYIDDGRVAIAFRPITIVEEYIGECIVNKMLIKFAHIAIVLEPIGTMLIGSKGRVDVIGPFGKTPLLLLNNKARRLSDMFQIRVTTGNAPAQIPAAPEPSEPLSWEWRLVSKSAGRELIGLNQEVILGLFAEVANGYA